MNENSIHTRANVHENEVPAFQRFGMAINLYQYCLSAIAQEVTSNTQLYNTWTLNVLIPNTQELNPTNVPIPNTKVPNTYNQMSWYLFLILSTPLPTTHCLNSYSCST